MAALIFFRNVRGVQLNTAHVLPPIKRQMRIKSFCWSYSAEEKWIEMGIAPNWPAHWFGAVKRFGVSALQITLVAFLIVEGAAVRPEGRKAGRLCLRWVRVMVVAPGG